MITDRLMICPTCGHRADAHSRGGMCEGRPSVCHCSRMAPIEDAIEFRPWMALHAGVTLNPHPDCTCDFEDPESDLCPFHERMFGPLSWRTLAFMVVDLSDALRLTDDAS